MTAAPRMRLFEIVRLPPDQKVSMASSGLLLLALAFAGFRAYKNPSTETEEEEIAEESTEEDPSEEA